MLKKIIKIQYVIEYFDQTIYNANLHNPDQTSYNKIKLENIFQYEFSVDLKDSKKWEIYKIYENDYKFDLIFAKSHSHENGEFSISTPNFFMVCDNIFTQCIKLMSPVIINILIVKWGDSKSTLKICLSQQNELKFCKSQNLIYDFSHRMFHSIQIKEEDILKVAFIYSFELNR